MTDKTELDLDAERASFETLMRSDGWGEEHFELVSGFEGMGYRSSSMAGAWRCWLATRRATIQPTVASERAPSRDSIDTAEFRKLSYAYAEALFKGTVPATQAAWGAVVAHIDARRAQPKGLSIALEEVTAKLGREAAENISLNMENIDLREQLARRTSTADAVRDARDDFARGYFCAVSVALREDGPVTTVRSLFSQGGDANKADPSDIDLFVEHGLMKSTPKEPA
jgi:hypothetical protein